jgi:hypothetical protein
MRFWALFCVFTLAGYLTANSFRDYIRDSSLEMKFDVGIYTNNDTKTGKLEIYFNQSGEPVLQLDSVPNQRIVYSTKSLPSNLTHLRIDPVTSGQAEIKIYRIWIEKHDQVVYEIRPSELATWGQSPGILSPKLDEDSFSFSSGVDPYIIGSLNVPTDLLVNNAYPIYKIINKWGVFGGAVGLIILLFSYLGWLGTFLFCLMLAANFIGIPELLSSLIPIKSSPPPVTDNIGYASYFGVSKGEDYNLFFVALLLHLLSTVVFAYLVRFCTKRRAVSIDAAEPTVTKTKILVIKSFAIFSGLILLAFYTLPNFSEALATAQFAKFSDQYDSQNLVSWSYFIFKGLLPMRDFWYPYSNFAFLGYGMGLTERFATIANYLENFVVFVVLLYSLYRVSSNSVLLFIATLLLLVILRELSIIDRFDRYFLGIDLVFLYYFLVTDRRQVMRIIFTLFFSLIVLLEPSQLLLTAPILILMTVIYLIKAGRIEFIKFIKWLALPTVILVLFCSVYVLLLKRNDQLTEFLRFYTTLSKQSWGGAFIAKPIEWLKYPTGQESWLTWTIFILLDLSVFYYLTQLQRAFSFVKLLPFIVVLVSFLQFQKQILRPHMALQILELPLVGFLLLGYYLLVDCRKYSGKANAALLIYSGLYCGFFGNIFFKEGAGFIYPQILERRVSNASNLSNNLATLFSDQSHWSTALQQMYQKSAFSFDGLNGELYAKNFIEHFQLQSTDKIYVLGDDSYLYRLLEKHPPFYITFYNASPLFAQQNTMQWLESNKPRYVLWDSQFKDFDNVPNFVRVPLIFDYIISHYAFQERFGKLDILRERQEGEMIDLNYWRTSLGDNINLKYIPSFSKLAEQQLTTGAITRDILQIKIDNPQKDRERIVSFKIDGYDFSLGFTEREGVKEYALPLRRLWFWNAGSAASRQIVPRLLQAEKNDRLKIIRLKFDREILY